MYAICIGRDPQWLNLEGEPGEALYAAMFPTVQAAQEFWFRIKTTGIRPRVVTARTAVGCRPDQNPGFVALAWRKPQEGWWFAAPQRVRLSALETDDINQAQRWAPEDYKSTVDHPVMDHGLSPKTFCVSFPATEGVAL